LAEAFNLFKRERIAGEVQQAIEQHRSVAGRENKAVTIEPVRIARIMLEKTCPEHRRHGRGPQWQAGMAAIRLFDGINGQET
jgi:hypothetical protein